MQSKNARKLLELSRLSADADDAPGWPIFHYYVTHTFGVVVARALRYFLSLSFFRWQQQRVVVVMSAHITVGWLIPDEMPSESGSWDRVISNLFFFTKSRTTWRRKEDGNKKEQSSVTSGFPHHPDVVPLGWIKKRAVKRMKNTPSRFQGYIHETSLRK